MIYKNESFQNKPTTFEIHQPEFKQNTMTS